MCGSATPTGACPTPAVQDFQSGSGMYAAKRRAAIAATFSREGRPLPSKNARRDPQQGQRVLVAIEESTVSPKIALPEPASTRDSLDRRTSSLGVRDHCRHIRPGERVPKHGSFPWEFSPRVRETSAGGRAATTATGFPHGTQTLVAGGRAAIGAAELTLPEGRRLPGCDEVRQNPRRITSIAAEPL